MDIHWVTADQVQRLWKAGHGLGWAKLYRAEPHLPCCSFLLAEKQVDDNKEMEENKLNKFY